MEKKTFEFWLKDTFYTGQQTKRYAHKYTDDRFNKLVKIMEPYRDNVETALSGFFNDDQKSWNSFKMSLWVAVPEGVQEKIERLLHKWAVEDDPQLPRKLAQDSKRKARTRGGALW